MISAQIQTPHLKLNCIYCNKLILVNFLPILVFQGMNIPLLFIEPWLVILDAAPVDTFIPLVYFSDEQD